MSCIILPFLLNIWDAVLSICQMVCEFATLCGCGGMVDALVLGTSIFDVGVQVPSSAPFASSCLTSCARLKYFSIILSRQLFKLFYGSCSARQFKKCSKVVQGVQQVRLWVLFWEARCTLGQEILWRCQQCPLCILPYLQF